MWYSERKKEGSKIKKLRIILAAALVAVMLSGCGMLGILLSQQEDIVHYEDMAYSHPDMEQLQESLNRACEAAEGEDVDQIIEAVYAFYDEYDWFYTCYYLADIRYSGDLTDIYWSGEYDFCVSNSAAADAALEELYYALAQSPCLEELESEEYFGAGFFDSYQGENLWDEEFVALMEQEAELQSRYYELSEAALEYETGSEEYYDACAEEMAQVLLELIRVRQEQAAWWGYDDYCQYAWDSYYYRDYTVPESAAYLEDIRQELVPLYRQLSGSDFWENAYEDCSEQETFDYVRTAAKNMGGTIEDAFNLMEEAELYDISYGENKYNSSFEVYLTWYWEPFIFMNPSLTNYDCLTFAHEFGHFCNDYASYGSYAGTDVMEVFSQGMEYLSLCYTEDSEDLARMKMADSLCLFVEQAAFASFEQKIYGLSGDDLTVENLCALYEETAEDYGFGEVGFDAREFVSINHYFTNPMYIISYVVSNDAAMQLYQLEQEEQGAGLRCFEENLATESGWFLEFLDSAGLESPFAEGRLTQVRKTFEEVLS